MPQFIIPAALSTGLQVATTIGGLGAFQFSLLGYSFATGIQSVFASILASTAMGYALNALQKPKSTGTSSGGYGINVNQIGSTLPTATIYGEAKVGGVNFYQEVVDTDMLYQGIAMADHEVEGFQKIFMNDEEITATSAGFNSNYLQVDTTLQLNGETREVDGYSQYATRLGTLDQEYVPILNSANDWGPSNRASGVAYLFFRHEYSRSYFPNGVPVISAIVRGKKVYDPRTLTTAWSDNPAICLRDYLLSSSIADADEIDEDLFTTAANICDEVVPLAAGGSQKRYTCNGSFTSDESATTIINSILATMGGMIWYTSGKWGIKAASFTSSILTLDEDDLRSSLSIQTRNSRREGFNKVIGIFRGPESSYQPTNFPEVTSEFFLSTDNQKESTFELDLPFVDTSAQAQRIAKIALYRNREQLKISGTFGMRALQVGVGDIIKITNSRLGFTEKLFEVSEWTFGLNNDMALEVSMSLQEISSEIFEWDADETAFESNNTNLLSPFYVPNVGFTTTSIKRVINEHVTNVLAVDVTSSNPEFIDKVEVEYLLSNTKTLFADTFTTTLSPSLWSDTYWAFSGVPAPQSGAVNFNETNANYIFFGYETGSANETFFDPLVGSVAAGDELTIVPVGSTGAIESLGEATISIRLIDKIATASGRGYFRIEILDFISLNYPDSNIYATGGLVFGYSTFSFDGDIWFKYRFKSAQETEGFVSLGTGPLGRFEIPDTTGKAVGLTDVPSYFIRARAISTLGIIGPYTSEDTAYSNDITAPSAVTEIEKRITGGTLNLEWTPSSDDDLSHYKILLNTTATSFTDKNTQVVLEKVARPSTTVTLPAAAGTYFIVPYDKNGNQGAEASVTVNTDDLRSYSNTVTKVFGNTSVAYNWPTDSTETNVEEHTTQYQTYGQGIILTDKSIAPSEGTLQFATARYDDVGADKLVRISTDIDMFRFFKDGSTVSIDFDDLTGPIDSWTRSHDFNDLGSVTGRQWQDIQCIPYVRASLSADVNSYGDWQIARGEIFARRLTYKFVLKSLSNNITPFLGKITYRLEYD